jgi:hypothetical protein
MYHSFSLFFLSQNKQTGIGKQRNERGDGWDCLHLSRRMPAVRQIKSLMQRSRKRLATREVGGPGPLGTRYQRHRFRFRQVRCSLPALQCTDVDERSVSFPLQCRALRVISSK